jgi:predicted ATP-binding protein involved in virulence
MPEKKEKQTTTLQPAAVYFKSLTIRDVKCFKGEHTIDLSDGEGRPAQWTVILGNNNTGKTTLLKCLAGLEIMGDFKASEKISLFGLFKGESIKLDLRFKPRGIKDWENKTYKVEGDFLIDTSYESNILLNGKFKTSNQKWYYSTQHLTEEISINETDILGLKIDAYGASRKMSIGNLSIPKVNEYHENLFENSDLFNAEEWLLQLYFAKLQGNDQIIEKTDKIITKVNEILTSGLLPDVKAIWFKSEDKGQSFDNFLEFETDFGRIRLRDLGYGYQTMLAWVLDLVRRMFERYPDSPNPIKEPAIVLVDEIDLHLHPEWQRKIISHLTKYFPNTQFIVTAHSPLVVQSAEKINLVLLEKDGDHVNIMQPKIPSYQGWSLEEILTELMGLGERTHSEKYLELIRKFEAALDTDDYESAQAAYDELDKILHPESHQRKLLRLQMSSLAPA